MRKHLTAIACSLLVFFALAGVSGGTSITQGKLVRNVTMTWNGLTRYYDVFVPTKLAASPDLWIMLHPTINTPAIPEPFEPTSFIQLANANGAIVVWPISTYNLGMWYWDADFLDYSFGIAPDDSGYLRALILKFEASYPIADVFVSGMSSGAFMAHRVAIDSSDLVSAIGAASGQLYSEVSVNTVPLPEQPVSVLMLNGDDDNRVGYCGSAHEWGDSDSPSSDVTLDYWADVAGYIGSVPQLCTNGQPTSGVNGALIQQNGITVKFVREVGIGHQWVPGTAKVMWQFFSQNKRAARRR